MACLAHTLPAQQPCWGPPRPIDAVLPLPLLTPAGPHPPIAAALLPAQQAAAQLESAAKRSVDEELRRARRELREQAIGLAVGHASALLSKSVSKDDQQRLTGDYLGTVGEADKR